MKNLDLGCLSNQEKEIKDLEKQIEEQNIRAEEMVKKATEENKPV